MAIGDPYATLLELKARLTVTDADSDDLLTGALEAASRNVEAHCGRQFNTDAPAVERAFRATTSTLAIVDDIATVTGLIVATDDTLDGTFGTTWTAADYQLEPANRVRHGEEGWPVWKVRAVGVSSFLCSQRRTVRLTAQWGWATVPGPVKEATLIMAEELAKLKDAPFGVAGFDQFGAVRVRPNPRVEMLLRTYRRDAVLVA